MKHLVDTDWVVGQLIGNPDLLIAATALYHNLTLLTHNTRHFSRISGLQVEDVAAPL